MNISFGTDGWRAIVGCDFTADNLKKVVRAFANWLYSPGRRDLYIYKNSISGENFIKPPESGILIGYDTRFMSKFFAKTAADEFIKCAIPVFLSSSFVSSPSLAYSVKHLKAAGGIMITGSHNAAYYNGIKYKPEYGGSATSEIMNDVEKFLISEQSFAPDTPELPQIKPFSPNNPYIENMFNIVDMERIANSRFKIVSDPIYGSNIGLMTKIFNKIGYYVEEIRNEENPIFGGYNPQPIGRNIAPLVEKILRSRADIGFAFDGDGDTLGIVDSIGSFIQPHEIFAIVLWHLVENRKWSGGIVTTLATSDIIKSMALKYDLPTYETPVGFKHITELMLTKNILIGGEESGGIGIKNNIPDKDAALIALMVLEAMAYAGKGIDDILLDLYDRFGTYCFHRTDIHLENNDKKKMVIQKLVREAPKFFDNTKVREMHTLDGIKYILEDQSWILFRPSGTEAKFRIYVEAGSHEKANRLLSECELLINKLIN